MLLNEFQEFFVEHQKNYKIKEENRLAVLALGLSGECGEVTEVIKKFLRDDKIDKNHLAEELGDVMAYLAILADYFDFTLDEISKMVIEKNIKRIEKKTLQTSGDNR